MLAFSIIKKVRVISTVELGLTIDLSFYCSRCLLKLNTICSNNELVQNNKTKKEVMLCREWRMSLN